MDDLAGLGRRVLASQPFSALLGAELAALSSGAAESRIALKPELLQQHGFAHGGVVSYAADNALTFAGGSVLGPAVVTPEFKINYLRPASGTAVIARASVVYAGRTQAVGRCDVFVVRDGAETPCATAQGTIALLGDAAGNPSAGPASSKAEALPAR